VDRAFAGRGADGAEPVVAPTDRPWGQRTAYVRDPDGHLVELAEQVEEPPG
jgi:catechol 2,3-dioxygenase-like lactoylglutathione lyase family enzyme